MHCLGSQQGIKLELLVLSEGHRGYKMKVSVSFGPSMVAKRLMQPILVPEFRIDTRHASPPSHNQNLILERRPSNIIICGKDKIR